MNKFLPALLVLCLCSTASQAALAQTKKAPPINQNKHQEAKWEEASTNRVKTYVLRLVPGQDLRVELERFAKAKNIQAGFIVTGVGSLRKAALRLADKSDSTVFDGKYEIVSLVGTLSPDEPHLHLSISDGDGKTIGGHLAAGCEIYTTAEIVLSEAAGLRITREPDAASGYNELKVRKNTRRMR
jgi:predicted DNA-binding protein with PD1-like motif